MVTMFGETHLNVEEKCLRRHLRDELGLYRPLSPVMKLHFATEERKKERQVYLEERCVSPPDRCRDETQDL